MWASRLTPTGFPASAPGRSAGRCSFSPMSRIWLPSGLSHLKDCRRPLCFVNEACSRGKGWAGSRPPESVGRPSSSLACQLLSIHVTCSVLLCLGFLLSACWDLDFLIFTVTHSNAWNESILWVVSWGWSPGEERVGQRRDVLGALFPPQAVWQDRAQVWVDHQLWVLGT